MTLYVLKYNNYFNRKVLKEDSLSSYLTAPYYDGLHIDNVSFNPNDDIKTTQVFNFEPIGDYVICTIKTVNEGVETETIQSRWFILESKRERTGQYTVVLKRDVLADSYNTVISSPMYIEKGMVKDSDPYIFNKERIPLNQIKQSETLLKDNTESAWVVGYIPRNAFQTSTVITADVGLETSGADIYVDSLSNWDFYKYSNLASNPLEYIYMGDDIDNLILNLYVISTRESSGVPLTKVKMSTKKSGGVPTGWGEWSPQWHPGISNPREMTYKPEEPGYDYTQGYYRYIGSDYVPSSGNYTDALGYMTNTFTTAFYNSAKLLESAEHYDVSQLNNKIIYDRSTSLAYKIVIEKHLVPVKLNSNVAVNYLIALGNRVRNWLNWPTPYGENSDETFKFDGENTGYYTITLTQIGATVHTTLDSSRAHLVDAPYDMFFMPYNANLKLRIGSNVVNMSPSMSVSLAVAVGAALGSQNLYDIQLLPYCPLNLNVVNEEIDVSQIPFKNNILDSGGDVVGVLMWSSVNSFRKEIDVPISVDNIKITQQTDLYRFCSPNYANAFDFNVAMNGGLEKVYADCTYKPYEPYIHVYPSFSNLYGNDFSDNRGLVCGGDFSLPQVTSEWVGYQLNHKNMNSVFSSDIISLNQEKLSKYSINEEIKNELGNIIAQPNGITRTSAVTYNNKLFPFIEYYTCTEKEKSALENKITYEGMTIGRIDTINNLLTDVYGDCFVKGKVIRLNINDKDTHYLDEISKELIKGVYIHKEEESNE